MTKPPGGDLLQPGANDLLHHTYFSAMDTRKAWWHPSDGTGLHDRALFEGPVNAHSNQRRYFETGYPY